MGWRYDFSDESAAAVVKDLVARPDAIPAAVQAVLAGDDSRFGEIVSAFDAPVRRIVGRRLRDPHAREDVIQEIWIRVYDQLAKLLDVRLADRWIGRIARNCVTDHHRRDRRLQRFAPLTADVADEAPGQWVWELVEKLPAAPRQLMTLRYRDGLSYAEIAARLGVKSSTVRGRLYDARQLLRTELERRTKS